LGQKTTSSRSQENTRTKVKAEGKIKSKTGVAEEKPEKITLHHGDTEARRKPREGKRQKPTPKSKATEQDGEQTGVGTYCWAEGN